MIDIERRIIDLDVNLIKKPLPNNQDGYIEYNKDADEFSIIINSNHGFCRQRFTMAHELTHRILHKDIVMQRGQLDRDSLNLYSKEDKVLEKEANEIGAEFLMPIQAIRDIFNKKDKTNPEHIKQISDRLGVSELALKIQVRSL